MNDCKELSPHARIELVDAIVNDLYSPEIKYQQSMLDAMIESNSTLNGNTQAHFIFKGETYIKSGFKGVAERPSNSLDKSLRTEMKGWLKEQEQIAFEKTQILGYLGRMLLLTTYTEDFLKVLPPSLHRIVLKLDRHFKTGDGILQGEALEEFQRNNHDVLKIIKGRMALGLLTS